MTRVNIFCRKWGSLVPDVGAVRFSRCMHVVRGALRAEIPNAAPPLFHPRFSFYTTRLGDLWPWGADPALFHPDLGSALVTQVPGYLVQFPSVCLLSKSQHAHRYRC